MIALALAIAVAAPTDYATPCKPLADRARVERALEQGVCPEICGLTAPDMQWLSAIAYMCHGGLMQVQSEAAHILFRGWAGGMESFTLGQYQHIVRMCASAGCPTHG